MKMMLRLSGSCFLIKELCSILKDQSKLIVVNISKKNEFGSLVTYFIAAEVVHYHRIKAHNFQLISVTTSVI